jgi:hypothetical protein
MKNESCVSNAVPMWVLPSVVMVGVAVAVGVGVAVGLGVALGSGVAV